MLACEEGLARIAVRTRDLEDIVLGFLVFRGERTPTVEALGTIGLSKTRIHAHSIVEDKALALPVIATHLLEVS